MARITVNKQLCKGCELCTLQCARGLLYLSKEFNSKGYRVVQQKDAEKCTACRLCAYMCPEAAITVYKEEK